MTILTVEIIYQAGMTLYFMVRRRSDGYVWNTQLNAGDGAFEVWDSGNWAEYAIPLVEQVPSGYYVGAYPIGIGAELTSETFYVQAGGLPVALDAPPFNLVPSQGQNIEAVAGSAQAADNLGAAAGSQQTGSTTGTPTSTNLPTDLTSTTDDQYLGRILIMTSGAANKQAQYIIAYNGTTKILTLAAPLITVPAASDTFVVV